jgi:ATP-dependent Clp protease ATP-binding subunit ClpC
MQTETGIVYKYFDLLDGFIRVRLLADDEDLQLPPGQTAPPDRRHYRRLVVRQCIVEPEDLLERVLRRFPDEEMAAEGLLYQICIDVNPRLEIHSVTLSTSKDSATAAAETQTDAAQKLRDCAPKLEQKILKEVFGQDQAVRTLCTAVRKAACGLADPDRPIGSYLLVGRTGCGKTELAKALARHLHDPQQLVRIDCSEFALPHETAKLIGSPPGYVGHNEGGMLTEALRANPHAVVLFDEIEKGHQKLHHMLLQILDDGRLTDSKGQTVSFQHAVILLTSNVGTEDYRQAATRLGFGDSAIDGKHFRDLTQIALEREFRPEMLNRLDGILTFHSLDEQCCSRIAAAQLHRLKQRIDRIDVALKWTPAVAKHLARLGFSEEYGAREVRRTVARLVEEPLSQEIMDGSIQPGDQITVRWMRNQIRFERLAA